MKIVFDFDHTLFSTKKIYQLIKESFFKFGVCEQLFQETYQKLRDEDRGYNPFFQLKLIKKEKFKIEENIFKKEFEKVLKKAPQFLYQDTIWFLKKWQGQAELILISLGEEKFQKSKIRAAGIEKYFQEIVITQGINKIKDFKKFFRYKENIIFVEDDPGALSIIKEVFPKVITIRINRGEGKYIQEPDNSQINFSIKNLKELDEILKFLWKLCKGKKH